MQKQAKIEINFTFYPLLLYTSLMNKSYSKRLGVISKAQIQQALDRFKLGVLKDTGLVEEGLFGQNFFVTSDKGEYVFRGVPHYDWQFPSEQFFANQLHQFTNTPVPHPYLLDPESDIFGWPYVIMPRMRGISLKHGDLIENFSRKDQAEIIEALVSCLVEMQRLTWDYPGAYSLSLNSVIPFENGYMAEIKGVASEMLLKSMEYNNLTTQTDFDWAMRLLDEKLGSLELQKGIFVMRDFKPENLVFINEAGKWQVNGVFDLMEAYFGYGEADLARTYARFVESNRKDLAEAFIHKYAEAVGTDINAVKYRLPAFLLIDRAIVWEWVQRPSNNLSEPYNFTDWMRRYF
jgi:hygromycin-B 7''-O-kinase